LKVGNWFTKPPRRELADPSAQLLARGFKGYCFCIIFFFLFMHLTGMLFIRLNLLLLLHWIAKYIWSCIEICVPWIILSFILRILYEMIHSWCRCISFLVFFLLWVGNIILRIILNYFYSSSHRSANACIGRGVVCWEFRI
jgi:hypothetical protein